MTAMERRALLAEQFALDDGCTPADFDDMATLVTQRVMQPGARRFEEEAVVKGGQGSSPPHIRDAS